MAYRKEIEVGGRNLIIETGKLAKLASGSVTVQYGDTVVLAAVTMSDEPETRRDFFPLQVEYREKAYAAGKIPGGFFKREGRPSEKETVSARLTDRPIRPLFPKYFRNEVQILIFVLSSDKENDADVLGSIGASAALSISDIPFQGPIASIRVGRIDGNFVVGPTFQQTEKSDIDVIVAGTRDSILMVEGWSREASEEDMLEALKVGHQEIVRIVEAQDELVREIGKEKSEYTPVIHPEEMEDTIRMNYTESLQQALELTDKNERSQHIKKLVKEMTTELEETYPEELRFINVIVDEILKEKMREQVLKSARRIDSRGLDDIRNIDCEVALVPRAHGSALFTRGQTQSLAATTLGTKMDEQKVDGLAEESWKRYMLHYNFPPFCVGEVRPIRGTSRREVGHGLLAERALMSIIPGESDFPYTIRIVSDILESNGSSSMASVCAGSLSLMDAGVPVRENVAGIAMGLIKEDDNVAILTDILGDEDHMGDMDFKIAGTRKGITAFQMDIKLAGITFEILRGALSKAHEARLKILDVMDAVMSQPRADISPYAPKITTLQIPVGMIGLVIGPGGKTIREIIERTGVAIDIEDDGTVTIASPDGEASAAAIKIIEELTALPEAGEIYRGKVKKITNFGAFVEIMPGHEGLLHISEIEHHRINRVEDVLRVGDEVEVKLLHIEREGKYSLSRKALLEKEPEHSGSEGRNT